MRDRTSDTRPVALLFLCIAMTTLPARGYAGQAKAPGDDPKKALLEAAERTYELVLSEYREGKARGPMQIELISNWSKRILMANVQEATILGPIAGALAPKARGEHIKRMEELEKLVRQSAMAGAAGPADLAAAQYFRLEAASWVTLLDEIRKHQEERELHLKLPDASKSQPLTTAAAPLFVNVTRDGRYLVAGKVLDSEKLGKVLQAAQANNPHQRVVIRADEDVATVHVTTLMDLCARHHGLEVRLSVLTKRPKGAPSGDAAPKEER